MERIRDGFGALEGEAREWLAAQKLEFLQTRTSWVADIRYVGQSFELSIDISAMEAEERSGKLLARAFHAQYEQVYGYTDESAALEILDLRVTAVGVTPKPRLERLEGSRSAGKQSRFEGQREVYMDGERWMASVFERAKLTSGMHFEGPAVVEQYDTTIFVPVGFTITVDEYGSLIGEAHDGN